MKKKLAVITVLCSFLVALTPAFAAPNHQMHCSATITAYAESRASGSTANMLYLPTIASCVDALNGWQSISLPTYCANSMAYIKFDDTEIFECALSAQLKTGNFNIVVWDNQTAKGGAVGGTSTCKVMLLY